MVLKLERTMALQITALFRFKAILFR